MKKDKTDGTKRGGKCLGSHSASAPPGKPGPSADAARAGQSRRLLGKHYANRYGKRRG